MSELFDVRVPDIGDFSDVDVIEVLVAPGDRVEVEQSLVTLESDKATMEIPSPRAGVVRELCVALGAKVSEGDLLVRLALEPAQPGEVVPEEPGDSLPEAPGEAPGEASQAPAAAPDRAHGEPGEAPAEPAGVREAAPAAGRVALPEADLRSEVVVLGSGPGGYTAAFRAADLGKRVVLVERYPTLGGVCLNVGCIPSKALLHLASVIGEARSLARHGVEFARPRLDLARIRAFKDGVVDKLTGGLAGLAKRRDVAVVRGTGRFEGSHVLSVENGSERTRIAFEHAIVAVGSRAARLPGLPDDPRILDSTSALALEDVPRRLLVIGGGIIGLELASVFHALGSRVTVVELLDRLIPGADRDVVKPLQKIIESRYENVFLRTKVTGIDVRRDGLHARFEGQGAPASAVFDRVLVAVGRLPNGDRIGAERAGLPVDEHGFLRVDDQQRTEVPHIFAIGDVVGEPMLAHKATHEGKAAAEVIAGMKTRFDAAAIPSVSYTDPEVAWMGLTEAEAERRGIPVRRAVFPWQASGRALGIGRPEGLTKLLFDPESGRLVGAGIVGAQAGELVAELVLALEMGADAEDIALSIHPHPTLSETSALAAEMAAGTITDLYLPRPRARRAAAR